MGQDPPPQGEERRPECRLCVHSLSLPTLSPPSVLQSLSVIQLKLP